LIWQDSFQNIVLNLDWVRVGSDWDLIWQDSFQNIVLNLD